MRLWERLTNRAAGGYWEGVASGAAVLTTSYAGTPDREAIPPQLAAWAANASTTSAVVFAATAIRMSLLSEATFTYQAKDDKHLFGNTSLAKLEEPWPNGTSGDLLSRMEQDVSWAGNAYIWDAPGEDRLVRLRPDWVTIVSELVEPPGGGVYRRVTGYLWEPPKSVTNQGTAQFYPAGEVVHWAPLPDPCADFRGMSWLTPVVRDVAGDDGMTKYKIKYLENAASPNLLIKYQQKLAPGTIDRLRERVTARYAGVDNAFRTLILDQGADTSIIGSNLQQMDFSNVASAGSDRILAAAMVPGVLVGLEPLRGAGRGYQESMQKLANVWARPQWRSACGALSQIMDVPAGNRLWFDTADIAALQDGELERGQASLVKMQAALAGVQAGFTHESVIAFIESMDPSQLKAGGIGTPTSGPQVQHLLPQQQPGAVASPLPPTLGRLPVGPSSPGDGGDGSRPVPRPASARRAIEAGTEDGDDLDLDDWEDGDDLDLDDLLADAETPAEDGEEAARFNPYHAKAGSPTGGQFSSASGGGGAAKANGAKPHGGTATLTAGHAHEKHQLRERAAADRVQAHHLQAELAVLLKQMRVSVAAHKKAAATAKAATAAAKTAAHHKTAVHHKTAAHHRRTARHHHRHARSLHSRISALRTRIHTLLSQAKQLDAQAAKL